MTTWLSNATLDSMPGSNEGSSKTGSGAASDAPHEFVHEWSAESRYCAAMVIRSGGGETCGERRDHQIHVAPASVACPECGSEVPVRINAAVTLTGHLEDDHGFGFERVMRSVVAHANGSSSQAGEPRD